ncbi:MAG: ABC transporter ATP-binding protein [Acidimicrobiales bacterium]
MTARGPAALSIRDLVVEFDTPGGTVHAVDGVSYDVHPGETVGVVGESGCGKTVTVLAVLGLVPRPPGRVVSGQVLLAGRDLLGLGRKDLRAVRGREVAMVFQDPLTSLHPAYRVGQQVAEAVRAHDRGLGARAAWARAVELLEVVGVPRPAARARAYPHEWSGGMRQRAMIAMAIAHRPRVLIADEPTTALDVTIQAQVLDVLRAAQAETGSATVLITHDLGVIAEMADRVVVMYAGRVVEVGDVESIFSAPRHPYTQGLLASLPRLEGEGQRLSAIPGAPPSLVDPPPGCPFHPRCPLRRGRERCVAERPALAEVGGGGRRSACHFAAELVGAGGTGAGPARRGR